MTISAADVKKLRDATGSGMMDCKKALSEANGDFAEAEKILKKMGLAQMDKRSARATENGKVFVKANDEKAVLLEIDCETDFVARNEDFIKTGNDICSLILEKNLTKVTDEIQAMLTEIITKIKENMVIKGFSVIEKKATDVFKTYLHNDGAIGVVVKASSENPKDFDNEEAAKFVFNTALHVAAFTPLYLDVNAVDQDYKKSQEEIFAAQAASLNKPEKVVQGIVAGKLNKFLSTVCLMDQPWIFDDKQSTSSYLAALNKRLGTKIKIESYLYKKVGE